MKRTLVIIPARFESSRFPGKPLVDIGGQSMIERVYRQVKKAKRVDEVIVATDDQRILDAVKHFGGLAEMTSADHISGTDRCAELAHRYASGFDIIVNVQGDEPFIHPGSIDLLCEAFDKKGIQIASLCKSIEEEAVLLNPNVVKLVKDTNDMALYFSRHPIPYYRDSPDASHWSLGASDWHLQHRYFRHLGVYAFLLPVLLELSKLKTSSLEKAESLEQLRWLENGYRICMKETIHESLAIDTPADLEHVEKYLKSRF